MKIPSIDSKLPKEHLLLLNTLIGGLVEAALVVDPINFKVISANYIAEKTLMVKLPELVGSSIFDWMKNHADVLFWEEVATGKPMCVHSDSVITTKMGNSLDVERRTTHISTGGANFYLVVFYNQTRKKQIEYDLEKLIAELRATFESIAEGILVTDLNGKIRNYNKNFSKFLNLPFDLSTSSNDQDIYEWIEQNIQNTKDYIRTKEVMLQEPLYEGIEVFHMLNGSVLERTTVVQYARGQAIGRIFSFRDITELYNNATHLRLSAKVFDAVVDAVFITDSDFLVEAFNPATKKLLENDNRLRVGTNVLEFFVTEGHTLSHNYLQEYIVCNNNWRGEVTYFRPGGNTVTGSLSIVAVLNELQKVENYVLVLRDISEKIQAAQRIEKLAYTDILTGLPNRLQLMERLKYMLPLAKRRHETFGVAFLDLDRFKTINDSLGHYVGDEILVDVSNRLKLCVREIDMIARIGGDEFVLLLSNTDKNGIELVFSRIMEQLSKPLIYQDFNFSLSCSMGVAMYPIDGDSAEELIKNADTAMYKMKKHGRAGYRFYQPHMNVETLTYVKMDNAIRQGILNDEFYLNYQPKINLNTMKRIGVEALLRWNSPTHGVVPPSTFIPIAEETGFIVKLGKWVLEKAIAQAAQWQRQGTPTRIAVNVSGLQFQQSNFVEVVSSILSHNQLDGKWLELEITESVLLQDIHDVREKFRQLSGLGVQLGLDDFGTGYSSLTYLKTFSIDRLKIDRSFVKDLQDDKVDQGIIDAIITIGNSLGIQVIAEGVETIEQARLLQAMGCHEGQGFLWSPAVAPEVLEHQRYAII